MRSQKTKRMVETALMGAVLCILAPFTVPVPFSPVPLSFSTFAVYLAAVILGAKRGALCVLVYLLLGLAGLPVFSGFSGGIGVLSGPTGGYLLGYLPCAVLVGYLTDKRNSNSTFGKYVVAMALGTLSCYLLGTVWFLMVMGGSYTVMQALVVCVLPYLVFDAAKILAVASVAGPVKRILRGR